MTTDQLNGRASEPVSARRAQTRERLMDAAVEVFAERGVLAATVEEIAERAGFTRGAFYSNFESKDELCLDLLARLAESNLKATREATDSLPKLRSGPGEIDSLIENAVTVFFESQRQTQSWLVAHAELRLYALRNPMSREPYLALNKRTSEAIADLLGEALIRVGARLVIPIEQAIDLLYAVWEHSGMSALIRGLKPDNQARKDQLSALLRSMVVSED